MTEVSVIICSFNRAVLLSKCLDHLVLHAKEYAAKLEVIVVDNGSTDQTKQVVHKRLGTTPFELLYVSESKAGLSNARNKGAEVAKAEWLFYLDDDGLVVENTFDQLFHTIHSFDFDFFGGSYKAYHASNPPDWLPTTFGNKNISATKTGSLNGDTISGGIMVIKKSVLLDQGGFLNTLGMRANAIGYGEEVELQVRLQKAGYKLGINPDFLMLHLVGVHKYDVAWHLRAAFALGRDGARSDAPINHRPLRSLLWVMPIHLIRNTKRWITERSYTLNHLVYDSFVNPMVVLGFLWSKLNPQNDR